VIDWGVCSLWVCERPPFVSSSIGSSRLVVESPLLHGEISFTDWREETVKPSLCHSYRSPIKGQVIALPSHGQNTAAVKLCVSQGRRDLLFFFLQEAMFLVNRRGLCLPSSFLIFVSFLVKHASVGLTIVLAE